MKNETALQAEAADRARAQGMRVAYSAAPFDAGAVRAVMPHAQRLMRNEGEAAAALQVQRPGASEAIPTTAERRRVLAQDPAAKGAASPQS